MGVKSAVDSCLLCLAKCIRMEISSPIQNHDVPWSDINHEGSIGIDYLHAVLLWTDEGQKIRKSEDEKI